MLSAAKKIVRHPPALIAFFLVALGIAVYLVGIPFLDLVELETIDLRFRSRGALPSKDTVVLAVIDEKSVDAEGRWVWPRSKIASLVDKLSAGGARVIAFDIGFFEADEKSVVRTVESIERGLTGLDDAGRSFLQTVKHAADNDRLLAEAIQRSKSRVVLGYFFQMTVEHAGDLDADVVRTNRTSLQNATYRLVRYTSEAAQTAALWQAPAVNANIPSIARTTPYAGYFNMFPDPDGVVRWIPTVMQYGDMLLAPLSLMTAGAFLSESPAVTVAEYGVAEVRVGGLKIPTDDRGQLLINYRGPQKTFPHVSATDILHDRVPAGTFADKIVMVGATAVGIYDMRVTPFANVYPGLEIHANIVDNILAGDFMYQPSWAALFDITAILLAGLVLVLVLPRVGAFAGGATAGVFFLAYLFFCRYLFAVHGWVLNMLYPLTVAVGGYIGITAYKYLVETRQKRFIRNAFSTYLAPSVVKQLIDAPEHLVLGGEEREISAFFSDVQGFTSIAEQLTPAELVELLNEFLTEMTDIILKNEGTVDKFEGDAIIAFFGAPNVLANQALTACLTCIDMQKRLAGLRSRWKAGGRPELFMRVGLCTGPAVVGNMGSKNRMDYTMMGDTVNTAARLEGVNKVYGCYNLVCEKTLAKAREAVWAREIDAINVVGRRAPVTVHELLGRKGEETPDGLQLVENYGRGLAAYRRREWDAAAGFFSAALELSPGDGPSRTMLQRCREYDQTPPPTDWNGAFSMKTK